jgi:hypothetical protein
MSVIYCTCPQTAREFSTGILLDGADFEKLPDVEAKSRCPHCGRLHSWSKHTARLGELGPSMQAQH